MTTLYRLVIASSHSFEEAWNLLEESGIDILYGSQEEEQIEIYIHLSSLDSAPSFPWIITCEPYTLPPIDWQDQWATHGHHFQDGYVNVPLASLTAVSELKQDLHLRLKPGPGFGDLSHPTTRLMMKMLAQYIRNQTVIDIGCGSGILTLAAVAMGAPMAYGIDIDPQAIEHSHQNASVNHLEEKCKFNLTHDFTWHRQLAPLLILMNMIRTEQLNAWHSLQSLHDQPAEILTSGIRSEERLEYLEQMTHLGWILTDEQEEMGWLTFHFLHPATALLKNCEVTHLTQKKQNKGELPLSRFCNFLDEDSREKQTSA